MDMTPKYKHDSKCCIFLGHKQNHDIYFCDQDMDNPTLWGFYLRYGNNPEDYISGVKSMDDIKFYLENTKNYLYV